MISDFSITLSMRFCYLTFLFFTSFNLYAQNQFTGYVVDKYDHEAIKNARIASKSSSISTDTKGEFKLEITAGNKTIRITKNGYEEEKFIITQKNQIFGLSRKAYKYLNSLPGKYAFDKMQSVPFNHLYGDVNSVKIVYSIKDDRIYYINSAKYLVHYDFAQQALGYLNGPEIFSSQNYKANPDRRYILGYLNYFKSSDTYTLDFHVGNGANCEDIKLVYDKIFATSYIGKKLFLNVSTDAQRACDVPKITDVELYKGQNYQALNNASFFGYLRKIDISKVEKTYLSRHDIAVVNGIPGDISVVAGIITTEFQTPLSHINVLSHNRRTPNMALKNAWTNPLINKLENKLVYLAVTLDSFEIREATLAEANVFWNKCEPSVIHTLKRDTLTRGLVSLTNADYKSVSVVGGKAANYAEMMKITFQDYNKRIPLPENAFAIPFYYYQQHLKKNGLDIFIGKMLRDSLFYKDGIYKEKLLTQLQDSIKTSPLDPQLIELVKQHMTGSMRFRSSTNAEDIEGFNGAGLYDSYTGKPGNKEKPFENAIRKVWASLWNVRAFDEREYFKIDQRSIAMGVLVHRSFPAEAANGVVITKNFYNKYNEGMVINVRWVK